MRLNNMVKDKVVISNFKGGINQFKLMIDKIFEVAREEHKNKKIIVKGKFSMEIL